MEAVGDKERLEKLKSTTTYNNLGKTTLKKAKKSQKDPKEYDNLGQTTLKKATKS